MADPFAQRRREVFDQDHMPDWTVDAACRAKVTVAGMPWEAAFTDDLTYKPKGEYAWPALTLEVMKTCATCPVQRQCRELGFEIEHEVFLGTRIASDEEFERWGKPYIEEYLTPMPVGVYGGIPGPMRERFKTMVDGLTEAAAWFLALSIKEGWIKPANEEVA